MVQLRNEKKTCGEQKKKKNEKKWKNGLCSIRIESPVKDMDEKMKGGGMRVACRG